MSPSLRGSGLKYVHVCTSCLLTSVSLFTREWIEIVCQPLFPKKYFVSLFTREWIEILSTMIPCSMRCSLPLYEGVDWNLDKRTSISARHVSLFTREWIEIILVKIHKINILCLPLYEGVDWNCFSVCVFGCCIGLPLYEGVDWNVSQLDVQKEKKSPSLRGSGLKLSRTA